MMPDLPSRAVVLTPLEEPVLFKVMILICASTVEHAACTPDTAIDIVRGPPAHSLSQCVHESQETLAATSIRPEMGKQYMKVVCAGDQPS